MSLRICLVTPFAWSQPHDVNEHVAGVAKELRGLGHTVTVLASSNRARDLAAGRRALLDGLGAEVVALGPAVPISRRSRIGVPVGARANLSLALALGRFDVVHGFEPGLPSLSYLALRDAQAMTVATFLDARTARLSTRPGTARPPARAHRRARRDERGDAAEAADAFSRPVPRHRRGNRPDAVPAWAETQHDRARMATERARHCCAACSARSRSCLTGSSSCCVRSRWPAGRRSRVRCATACTCEPRATELRVRHFSRRRASSSPRSPGWSACVSKPRRPDAQSQLRPARASNPSSQAPKSPGSPRTRSTASARRERARAETDEPELRGRGPRARRALPLAGGTAPRAARIRRSTRRPAVGALRLAHAHQLVDRLRRRSRRPDHAGGGDRPGRDRRHRSQRVRRRARDAGARARP